MRASLAGWDKGGLFLCTMVRTTPLRTDDNCRLHTCAVHTACFGVGVCAQAPRWQEPCCCLISIRVAASLSRLLVAQDAEASGSRCAHAVVLPELDGLI